MIGTLAVWVFVFFSFLLYGVIQPDWINVENLTLLRNISLCD